MDEKKKTFEAKFEGGSMAGKTRTLYLDPETGFPVPFYHIADPSDILERSKEIYKHRGEGIFVLHIDEAAEALSRYRRACHRKINLVLENTAITEPALRTLIAKGMGMEVEKLDIDNFTVDQCEDLQYAIRAIMRKLNSMANPAKEKANGQDPKTS